MITIGFYDSEHNKIIHNFPSKREVCWNCEGHGTHLTASIREHAYSAEEFYEAFHDEEDREAYFAHGGKYDVVCETCKGERVIDVIDKSALYSEEDKQAYQQYLVYQRQEAEFRREQEFERRMGC